MCWIQRVSFKALFSSIEMIDKHWKKKDTQINWLIRSTKLLFYTIINSHLHIDKKTSFRMVEIFEFNWAK